MNFLIKKCPKCRIYTLNDLCPRCNSKTKVAHPPKFSPIDKYVRYRFGIKYEQHQK